MVNNWRWRRPGNDTYIHERGAFLQSNFLICTRFFFFNGFVLSYPGDSVTAERTDSRACEHHVAVQEVCRGVSPEGEVVWNTVLL